MLLLETVTFWMKSCNVFIGDVTVLESCVYVGDNMVNLNVLLL